MKAKVKTTGEVIEVSQQENIITKRGVERQYVDNKRSWCTYVQSELEFIKEEPHKTIDWEQRRYEIVKDYSANWKVALDTKEICERLVKFADKLIKQLKIKTCQQTH